MGGPKSFPQALVHERSHTSRPLYCGDLILEEESRAGISWGPCPAGVSVAFGFYIMVSCLPLRGHTPSILGDPDVTLPPSQLWGQGLNLGASSTMVLASTNSTRNASSPLTPMPV